MNNYYSLQESYYEEPQTASEIQEKFNVGIKEIIETFQKDIESSRYKVNRPTARIIDHVEKQNRSIL